ncbi:MAG: peptidylprolyl isomerase [Oscillospiraceae bacterium]|nr:peptidylprolyl isomerase [Oscillospiraceae bacterium]
MKKIQKLLAALLAGAGLLALAACGGSAPQAAPEPSPSPVQAAPALETPEPRQESPVPASSLRHAEIEVEGYGTISLELDAATAPITVGNFVKLAQSGFYDGLTFHRIMDGFMIQGGDPEHNGSGGSEEYIKGEFAANGVENNISHVKGVISMARAGRDNPYTGVKANDSASSQFFIMVADGPFLDGQYAAFGRVTDGLDIVERIAKDARPIDNNGTVPYEQQPVMTRVTVTD